MILHCRFLPVKQTSDLLMVMSNLYTLQQGSLVMSPKVSSLYSCQQNLAKFHNTQRRPSPLRKSLLALSELRIYLDTAKLHGLLNMQMLNLDTSLYVAFFGVEIYRIFVETSSIS